MPETKETIDLLTAVRALVAELQKESASGLISRKALVALDRVQQLLDARPKAQPPRPLD